MNNFFQLIRSFLYLVFAVFYTIAGAQDAQEYKFTNVYNVKTTPVSNQQYTNTCWSFSTVSFLETEYLRNSGLEMELSEAFFIRKAYLLKAQMFMRTHGNTNFSAGGQAHDAIGIYRKFGAMDNATYRGWAKGDSAYDYMEMDTALRGFLKSICRTEYLSNHWLEATDKIMDAYMGAMPDNITYNGTTYSPLKFAVDVIKLDPDDYVEITSYTHHPFYVSFPLEIPDNWAWGYYYNVPLAEFIEIMENALKNGYSFVWSGDVANIYFNNEKGYARLPALDSQIQSDSTKKYLERPITQDFRQKSFDNRSAMDEHLMHVVGLAKDQYGTKYFYTKNTWGVCNLLGGYMYLSEAYMKRYTIAITVHKDAIPKDILKKLNIYW